MQTGTEGFTAWAMFQEHIKIIPAVIIIIVTTVVICTNLYAA